MPSITIPDEAFERLAERAAARNMTTEQLIASLLSVAAESSPAVPRLETPFDAWKKTFDKWMADVGTRANRYPAGFVLDDSRESIYEGCGE